MLFLLAACQDDFNLNVDYGADGQAPIVRLEPQTLDFGALAQGEVATGQVEVFNEGDGELWIDSLVLDGSTDFTLLSEVPESLTWGDSFTIDLAFSPSTNRSGALVRLTSNDPARPEATAQLEGAGAYPALGIAPNPYDLGSIEPSCARDGSVDLVNYGEAPLTVSAASFSGGGFTVLDAPQWPVVLAPRESMPLSLRVESSELGAAQGRLYVSSDDPAGIRTSQVDAYVEAGPDEVVDTWRQPDGPWDKADILVYVDQSGSMSDDQSVLASNFANFGANLDAMLSDWQLMVSNADDGCHTGDILTPYNADAASAFSTYVRSDGGSWTEAGLTIADHALDAAGSTGCNAGFLREDSKNVLLLVSDEPEQSRDDWLTMTDRIRATSPTAMVVAIVGPVPGGCGSAAPGYGYVEAAAYTDGLDFEICESDWGDYFPEIASLSTEAPTDRFALSHQPSVPTLVVAIDGEESHAWTFESDTNELVFNASAVPAKGSWIEASYAVSHDCAGE